MAAARARRPRAGAGAVLLAGLVAASAARPIGPRPGPAVELVATVVPLLATEPERPSPRASDLSTLARWIGDARGVGLGEGEPLPESFEAAVAALREGDFLLPLAEVAATRSGRTWLEAVRPRPREAPDVILWLDRDAPMRPVVVTR